MVRPSTSCPAEKSTQWGLLAANVGLVAIFIVGTKVPKGVPRPVVNSTIWQPAKPKRWLPPSRFLVLKADSNLYALGDLRIPSHH